MVAAVGGVVVLRRVWELNTRAGAFGTGHEFTLLAATCVRKAEDAAERAARRSSAAAGVFCFVFLLCVCVCVCVCVCLLRLLRLGYAIRGGVLSSRPLPRLALLSHRIVSGQSRCVGVMIHGDHAGR